MYIFESILLLTFWLLIATGIYQIKIRKKLLQPLKSYQYRSEWPTILNFPHYTFKEEEVKVKVKCYDTLATVEDHNGKNLFDIYYNPFLEKLKQAGVKIKNRKKWELETTINELFIYLMNDENGPLYMFERE